MSGHGQTEPVDAAGLRVVVIAGTWHDVITDGLIAGAARCSRAPVRRGGRSACPDRSSCRSRRRRRWMPAQTPSSHSG
jgi:hypothetical protein